MMRRLGFKQLIKEATQIEGRIIDHVYWRDTTDSWAEPEVTL